MDNTFPGFHSLTPPEQNEEDARIAEAIILQRANKLTDLLDSMTPVSQFIGEQRVQVYSLNNVVLKFDIEGWDQLKREVRTTGVALAYSQLNKDSEAHLTGIFYRDGETSKSINFATEKITSAEFITKEEG